MKINISRLSKYIDINIETWDANIDLGLHDQAQAEILLNELESACDDLREYIEKQSVLKTGVSK